MASDVQVPIGMELKIGAKACKGILFRKGAGNLKHLHVRHIRTQRAIIEYSKGVLHIPREYNIADMFTHGGKSSDLDRLLEYIGAEFWYGNHAH